MTRMIFVRHGESFGNHERRFYGIFDRGLTDLGKMQADRTGEYIAKNYKLDVAYASDLGRALDTGCRIASKQGLEVIADTGLREISAGKWENELFTDIQATYAADYDLWKTDIYNSCPTGGEAVKDLCERVRRAVWEIAEKNDGKTVLLALHATPIRSLECEWRGEPYENMKDHIWVKNASVSVVDYDIENHKVTPLVIGEAEFLADMITSLPKTI
ncbi:MAG: histidine phosphatase family protein [Clostridia bacterium]|nr:histidine phosphatase family protein [Clostridia bacterium]